MPNVFAAHRGDFLHEVLTGWGALTGGALLYGLIAAGMTVTGHAEVAATVAFAVAGAAAVAILLGASRLGGREEVGTSPVAVDDLRRSLTDREIEFIFLILSQRISPAEASRRMGASGKEVGKAYESSLEKFARAGASPYLGGSTAQN